MDFWMPFPFWTVGTQLQRLVRGDKMCTWLLTPRAARKKHRNLLDECPGGKRQADSTFPGNHISWRRSLVRKKDYWAWGLNIWVWSLLLSSNWFVSKVLWHWGSYFNLWNLLCPPVNKDYDSLTLGVVEKLYVKCSLENSEKIGFLVNT